MIFHKRCGWGAARWKEIATWGFSLLNQFCDSGSWQNKLLKQNYFDGFFISKEDRTVCSRASGRPAQINTDLVALMKLHRAQYKKQPKNKSAIKTKLWLWVANFVVVYHDSNSFDSACSLTSDGIFIHSWKNAQTLQTQVCYLFHFAVLNFLCGCFLC